MPRAVVSALLLLAASSVFAAPAPFTKPDRPYWGPSKAQILDRRRVSAAFVHPGMTNDEVIAILGPHALISGGGKIGYWSRYYDIGVTVKFSMDGLVEWVERDPAP